MENIILIGFMGSGKTSIGRELARITGFKYADMDKMIVKHKGMSIKKIFALYGEDAFRDIESLMVKKAAKMKKAVIATGGGVVKREGNIKLLRKAGTVVYLKTGFDAIVERIRERDDRPLFDMNNLNATKMLYKGRLPVYSKAAHFTIVTEKHTVKSAAKAILKKAGLNFEKNKG